MDRAYTVILLIIRQIYFGNILSLIICFVSQEIFHSNCKKKISFDLNPQSHFLKLFFKIKKQKGG